MGKLTSHHSAVQASIIIIIPQPLLCPSLSLSIYICIYDRSFFLSPLSSLWSMGSSSSHLGSRPPRPPQAKRSLLSVLVCGGSTSHDQIEVPISSLFSFFLWLKLWPLQYIYTIPDLTKVLLFISSFDLLFMFVLLSRFDSWLHMLCLMIKFWSTQI